MNTRDGKIDRNALLLLDEISKNQDLTQRDLSNRLGIALGLINSYLKALVSKGYITVSGIPRKRYTYYLTPKGFSEKARLTYQHLQNLTTLYKVARKDFNTLFSSRNFQGRKVALCGSDEITEIAYLSLKEAGLELAAIAGFNPGRKFLGYALLPLTELRSVDFDIVVITSFVEGEALKNALIEAGVGMEKITDINTDGWLKRIGAARE